MGLRERLKALGLTEEQITSIVSAHEAEIKDQFVPLARFNEVNGKVKDQAATIKERDTQLATLGADKTTSDELKAQIKKLEDDNKVKATEYENNLKASRVDAAIKLALTGKVHDADLVSSILDKTKLELNEDGSIKAGFDEQFKEIKTSKPFLFVTEPAKPAPGWTPKGTKPVDGKDPGTEPPDPSVEMAHNIALAQTTGNATQQAANAHYFGKGDGK